MQNKLFFTLILLLFLSGCSTMNQHPVALDTELLNNSQARIGVVVSTLPDTNTVFPGASCLLCLAAASAFNSELSAFSKTLSTDELGALKGDIANLFKTQDIDTLVVEEFVEISELPKTKKLGEGFSKRDFSSYAERHQLDRLIVVDIHSAGIVRAYTSYVPAGPPNARVSGKVYMVDLTTHKYDWYLPIDMNLSAEGEWDEPPTYPGLTNAYYQLIEDLRDQILDPLSIL